MTYKELKDVLEGMRPEIKLHVADQMFVGGGGWRGLFDPHASEWYNKPLGWKLDILWTIMKEARVDLQHLVYLYREDCEKGRHRPDMAHGAWEAVTILLQEAMIRMHGTELENFVRDTRQAR